ncbi:hypothetical protein ACSSS7_004881 [Eimeria intestinalis]
MQSELIAVTREGLELHKASLDTSGALAVEKVKTIDGVESAEWSPKGDLLALVRGSAQQKLELVNANTWEVVHTIEGTTPVSKFSFSPKGSYLLVCFRFESMQCPENLRLVEIRGFREVARLPQRAVGELSWPPLRWTGEESFMCRLVGANQLESATCQKRGVMCFPSPERPASSAIEQKEKTEGKGKSATAQTAPRGPYCAVFSKEIKGQPATFEIYELGEEATCVAKKSFFQAQEVECQWAYDGRAVLVKTHTDASDLTYYGSSALYFLKSDGSYDVRLVAAEEGPVFAAIWSPCTLEFAVCYGKVPSTVALYDGSSKVTSPKFCLGQGMRTTLEFCPFAKLLLWGGFGNLAGEIEVWNHRKKGIVAKTLFFALSGALLKRVDFACLYSIQFRPLDAAAAAAAAEAQKEIIENLTVYKPGEVPMAPGAESTGKIGNFASTGRSLSSLTQNRTAGASSGAYRPPASRGTTTAKLPPGAAEVPGTSSGSGRNARKRQNRKNKQEGEVIQSTRNEAEAQSEKCKETEDGTTPRQKQEQQGGASPTTSEECGNSSENKVTLQTADV